jgi:PAS domain S-box-containing protein
MKKEKKTRGQLISELAKLRQRIAELEKGEAEQKLKEQTLRESKELFEKTFVSQLDAFFILDTNNPPKILDCNPSATRVFGHSRKEMLGRTTDFLHVDKRRRRKFQEHLHPAIAKQGFFHLPEFEMKRNDGTVFPTEHTVVSLEDNQGKRIGWVSLVRDISERKRAEEALRESEERFKEMADNIREVFWLFDWIEQRVIYASPAYEEIWGRSIQDLYNRYEEWADSIYPEDLSYAEESFAKIVQTGGGEPREYRIIRPDRTVRWVSDRGFAITGEDGQVRRIAGIAEDITERKRAEEALKESNETLRAIINASPLAIMSIDSNSKVTIWNPAAESIFGWTEHEVFGQFIPMVSPEKSMEHQDLRERSFQGETFTGLEVIRQRKDGTLVDVRLSTAPVYNAKGNIKSVMAVIEDITERKLAEEALRESEQRYSSLFKNNHSVMLLIDPESAEIVDANPAACSFYGWSQKEITSKKITDINMLTNEQVFQEMERARSAQRQHFYFRHRLASEEVRDVEVYSGPIMLHGKQLLYSIIHDISKRKQAEEELRAAHEGLEQRTAELVKLTETLKQEIEERKQVEQKLRKREAELEIQASELEEVNTALRVLLKRREWDKVEVEEKTLSNVKELVLPYIERLKGSGLDSRQTTCVSILESNLRDIVSPFAHNLSSKYLGLTPTEIQIANLVKQGMTTKEIAEILNSSHRTVEFHRKNIRKKMGIVNSKVNLRSHLLSM